MGQMLPDSMSPVTFGGTLLFFNVDRVLWSKKIGNPS